MPNSQDRELERTIFDAVYTIQEIMSRPTKEMERMARLCCRMEKFICEKKDKTGLRYGRPSIVKKCLDPENLDSLAELGEEPLDFENV